MDRSEDGFVTGVWRAVLVMLAMVGLALSPAAAKPTQITPKLIAESPTPAPGGVTALALSMIPEPGWHGYWVNGGDAGNYGFKVDWTLPDGVSVTPLRFPVPEALTLFGLMNHAYEHPYGLLADVRIDRSVAPGTDLTLVGLATWLACSDTVCIPEEGVVSVKLTAGDGIIPAASRRAFDDWRAALPQPLDRAGHWERRGETLRVEIPLPATTALGAPHLFLESKYLIDYAAPQRFSRNGDWMVIETRAKGKATGPAKALLKLSDGRGLSVDLRPAAVRSAGEAIATPGAIDAMLFWTALGGAILGGLILNLMPCVFPILSLKALSLARSGEEARTAKIEALAYTAGAVLVCLALGGVLLALRSAGEQVGWAFQLQHPLSVFILLLLAVAITLNLLGAYALPSFGGGQKLASKDGAAGGFWTGALAAFVATPCSGPLLGAALGATLVLPVWAALPIFGGLGLGLALPFLALGFLPALRDRLPKPGPWMGRFRKWMALPMGLTALALAWLLWRQIGSGALLIWPIVATTMAVVLLTHYGAVQRGDRRSWLLIASGLLFVGSLAGTVADVANAERLVNATGSSFSPAALAKARAAGKPVFVNFTADWCLSCKANEAGAINREVVQTAFDKAGVVTLVGDWTNGDPVITRTLAGHGRNSVPLYLWYAPGVAEPEILPQILTPGLLTDKAGG